MGNTRTTQTEPLDSLEPLEPNATSFSSFLSFSLESTFHRTKRTRTHTHHWRLESRQQVSRRWTVCVHRIVSNTNLRTRRTTKTTTRTTTLTAQPVLHSLHHRLRTRAFAQATAQAAPLCSTEVHVSQSSRPHTMAATRRRAGTPRDNRRGKNRFQRTKHSSRLSRMRSKNTRSTRAP